MKEFNFRLQSVLNLKEQQQDSIQKELMQLHNQYSQVEQQINNYQQKKINYLQQLKSKEAEGINLNNMIRYHNYIDHLNQEIEELELKLNYWQEEISKCREKLLSKTKEKKVLDKLKDRKHEEYWEDFLREEQKFNDELATNSFNRKDSSIQDFIL